ncbi:long-chain fatty acid--CoA ligase [Mycolicibacterium sp. CBMA 226]|uniref:AMP-dependent synthetase/ligase n=1 Tax=Mycolicibacterium sp. CBMA 226 TaxID=2606611 RepID=UPI0012DE72A0|nr:AMP-dependent synthetase/ligase [Mycolicibacterium sp. CBMA 226]MUL78691.1 AMP-binding protein [Mycolicibacterium sp. CBMA 226]
MPQPQTLPQAFQQMVAARGDAVALRSADGARTYTWRQYADEVRRIAGGLAALGLRRGDTFAALLTNRPEFNLTEAAASHLGATTYSIYNTCPTEQIEYLLTDADTRIVVTERQYVDKVKAAQSPVEHILVIEDDDIGRLQPDDDFDFEAAWQAVHPDDVLCLIYTSGTTGPPKGVEHTHRSAIAMAEAVNAFYPYACGDTFISYLPSAHAADRFFTHYFGVLGGIELITLAEAKLLPAVLSQVRPSLFIAVPRTWEKLKTGVQLQLKADDRLKASFDVGAPHVIDAIKRRLGFDRLKWALSGAAAIAPDDFAFIQKLGIPVSEMWGMSECGLGTGAPPSMARQGTVGMAPPGAELRLADDGELLLRAPSVMKGYRNNPVKTAEAIDADGWLHSGDIAEIDDEGYVRIVDRKKELIINAAGKNMSPTNIEGAIASSSPLLGPVVAIGDGRPYNVALITLDPDAATTFAAELEISADPAAMAAEPKIRDIVAKAVEVGNAKLSRVEQIKRFTILPTFFAPGSDELTPTSKLKRKPIAAKYAAQIEELYA